MKTLYDIDFTGPIRPDHGRMIWGEVAMPGYGLYDRALGATYLNGLWEAIVKRQFLFLQKRFPQFRMKRWPARYLIQIEILMQRKEKLKISV